MNDPAITQTITKKPGFYICIRFLIFSLHACYFLSVSKFRLVAMLTGHL